MQTLRRARFLARLVLAWFVLSLGVAIASPVVKPASFEVVCSGMGTGAMKLVDTSDDGGQKPAGGALDCPLCSVVGGPPPTLAAALTFDKPIGHALQPIPAARIAAVTAAPLPARGPPPFPVV